MGRLEKLSNLGKMVSRFFNETDTDSNVKTLSLSEINEFFNKNPQGNLGSDLSETTYFTCLKILSETLGKLSIHLKDKENNRVYKHDTIDVLTLRTNQSMNPSTFKTLMEFNRNHYGNAYAYMKHDNKGNLVALYPLDPRSVTIWVDNAQFFNNMIDENSKIYYQYQSNSKAHYFKNDEVLHIKGLTQDGITGMCIREILARTIRGSKESQKYLNNLYEKGLTSKAILKYTGDLDTRKKKELQRQLMELVHDDNGDVIPVPIGFNLEPLNVKLTDSQFFELRKYTSLQIASAFGIKPTQINDFDKSSYANSEMQNLTFYMDTLLYILTIYEEEFNYKLLTKEDRQKGYKYEFNVAKILRGDLKSQAEALTTYTTGSIYTVNEARERAGVPKIDGGDKIMVNGSYVGLDNLGMAYKKE